MGRLIKGSIDLMKIEKSHIVDGKNGAKYINFEVFVNDDKEADQYGNNCGVKQSYKVGEDYKSHYIGNAKTVFGFDKAETATVIKPGEATNDMPWD